MDRPDGEAEHIVKSSSVACVQEEKMIITSPSTAVLWTTWKQSLKFPMTKTLDGFRSTKRNEERHKLSDVVVTDHGSQYQSRRNPRHCKFKATTESKTKCGIRIPIFEPLEQMVLAMKLNEITLRRTRTSRRFTRARSQEAQV
jgi:hypothetical protein